MTDDLNSSISGLRLNLHNLRWGRLQEIRAIIQLDEELGLAQTYLQQYVPSAPSANSPTYSSLCSYVTNYNSAITGLVQQSERAEAMITSGSYILSGTASYFVEAYPQAVPTLVKKIEVLREVRNDREAVYIKLAEYNKVLADTFLSAWQNLDVPAIDPTRGPAFLMRETITQFLHHFAPDNLVKTKGWYKPHDEKTDITRANRVRFILEERIAPAERNTLVELQLNELKKLYDELNKAHEQKALDSDVIKPLLYKAQDLFKGIMQVMNPPAKSEDL